MTNLCAPYNNHKSIITLLPLTSIGILIFVVIIGGICLVLSLIQRKEEYTLLPNIREKLPWFISEIFRLGVFKFQCHNLIIKGTFNNRCLMVSTNQADPTCFYFRISWILMEGRRVYFFSSPPFNAGPQKPQTLMSSKDKYDNSWPKI